MQKNDLKYAPEYKPPLRARNAFSFVELFEREHAPHFHVHFAKRAAHTALFVKAISGLPFSITAHGQDFMTDLGNDGLLRELCAAAEFVGAETNYSRDLLASRCPKAARKIFRVYNGIDLSRFPETADNQTNRGVPGPARLLSVGRLVASKRFHVLIDACTELKKRVIDFAIQIIGDAARRKELETH